MPKLSFGTQGTARYVFTTPLLSFVQIFYKVKADFRAFRKDLSCCLKM